MRCWWGIGGIGFRWWRSVCGGCCWCICVVMCLGFWGGGILRLIGYCDCCV